MVVTNDAYAALLAKIEDQANELALLEDSHGATTRAAYLAARNDIAERMEDLIERRGGLSQLSARDRFRLTRDAELISAVEGRLTQLGVQHESIVNQAFTDAAQLAQKHLPTEVQAMLDHVASLEGPVPRGLTAVDFARLDTAAIELGLGTAVRDTKALSSALQTQVTREITQGVVAGEGIAKLSRRLDVIPEISANRAEVITRWSTIKGYNLATQAGYEALKPTFPQLMKMWLAARDERTCPHCMALHGTTVAVDSEFSHTATYAAQAPNVYQGELEVPPRHPRCRCTITSWLEDWRPYTESTPQELHSVARQDAAAQGFPKAQIDELAPGVKPIMAIGARAESALGDLFSGIVWTDDFAGTVRFSGSLDEARLRLRNAGFRVSTVPDADDLLRVELPDGIPLPRMLRSTKLRALPQDRWDEIRDALLRCGALRA